jgi:hypothetical protein
VDGMKKLLKIQENLRIFGLVPITGLDNLDSRWSRSRVENSTEACPLACCFVSVVVVTEEPEWRFHAHIGGVLFRHFNGTSVE